jgi:hypothetical protein
VIAAWIRGCWQDVRCGFHILCKSPAPNGDHGILAILNRAMLEVQWSVLYAGALMPRAR